MEGHRDLHWQWIVAPPGALNCLRHHLRLPTKIYIHFELVYQLDLLVHPWWFQCAPNQLYLHNEIYNVKCKTTVPKMPSLEASEVKDDRVRFLERVQHLIIVATLKTNNPRPLFLIGTYSKQGICLEGLKMDQRLINKSQCIRICLQTQGVSIWWNIIGRLSSQTVHCCKVKVDDSLLPSQII